MNDDDVRLVHREGDKSPGQDRDESFPKLKVRHECLHQERDPEGEGLVYIHHPWESGMDNSPMWDQTMERIQVRPDQIPKYRRADTHFVAAGDRPLAAGYDRFAYLVSPSPTATTAKPGLGTTRHPTRSVKT